MNQVQKIKTVTVFGANGKVGSLVVELLLEKGYSVRAAVHSFKKSVKKPSVTYIECDIHNPARVEKALKGSDAVISCLGSWGSNTKDIQTSGMKNIIPAMHGAGISRIISITGSGVQLDQDDRDILNQFGVFLLRFFARKVYDDGKQHIALLAKSDLDWTVLRSPIMYTGHSTSYKLDFNRPKLWHRIIRQDVARALVALLNTPAYSKLYSKKSPFIHQGE